MGWILVHNDHVETAVDGGGVNSSGLLQQEGIPPASCEWIRADETRSPGVVRGGVGATEQRESANAAVQAEKCEPAARDTRVTATRD